MEMDARFHSSELLALTVFVHSLKPVNVRSVRLIAENMSSVCAIQQDFLLDPRKYVSVYGPVSLGRFRTFLSTVGVKETLEIIIRMQQTGGWHCVLSFQTNSPSETVIPFVLTPSKNPGLKDIPSLELDLKAVERITANSRRVLNDEKSTIVDCGIFPNDGNNATVSHYESCLQPISDVKLATQTGPITLEAASNGSMGLATPEAKIRTGLSFDIWQNWGSELELATPKTAPSRASLADLDNGISQPKPIWTLDLNVDAKESSAQEDESGCSLLLSTQTAEPQSPLDCCLETPTLSLQHSSITEESAEHCGLESFADSLSSFGNMHVFSDNGLAKLNALQCPESQCSKDSGGCHHGSVINLSPAERNGNSSMTSSPIYSAHDGNSGGGTNSQFMSCPLITSSNMYFMEDHENHVHGYGKQITLRQMENDFGVVKNKSRPVRPGSTSERITEITLQELSQYFSMPITQAAMKLNVGLTVLKKRCREFQIPRWPHRKMKSINSLIGNIKDLADEQGVNSSSRVINVVQELEEQMKLMEEMPGVELAERTKKLRQACFKANYKKRRLGMLSSNSVHLMHGYPPGQLSHLDWNPTFIDSPAQSSHTVDHFL